mmetsp:Transcript_79049/g.212319  ORF Transcript_79049/g.212319 Transcript_79049/m.212319 type:complete len:342 (+) Transcript_79049:88-1113(+)
MWWLPSWQFQCQRLLLFPAVLSMYTVFRLLPGAVGLPRLRRNTIFACRASLLHARSSRGGLPFGQPGVARRIEGGPPSLQKTASEVPRLTTRRFLSSPRGRPRCQQGPPSHASGDGDRWSDALGLPPAPPRADGREARCRRAPRARRSNASWRARGKFRSRPFSAEQICIAAPALEAVRRDRFAHGCLRSFDNSHGSTAAVASCIDALKNMLRQIVGFSKLPQGSWEEAGRRTKQNVTAALKMFPVSDWLVVLDRSMWHLVARFAAGDSQEWPSQVLRWRLASVRTPWAATAKMDRGCRFTSATRARHGHNECVVQPGALSLAAGGTALCSFHEERLMYRF